MINFLYLKTGCDILLCNLEKIRSQMILFITNKYSISNIVFDIQIFGLYGLAHTRNNRDSGTAYTNHSGILFIVFNALEKVPLRHFRTHQLRHQPTQTSRTKSTNTKKCMCKLKYKFVEHVNFEVERGVKIYHIFVYLNLEL